MEKLGSNAVWLEPGPEGAEAAAMRVVQHALPRLGVDTRSSLQVLTLAKLLPQHLL